jgi:hypothetical protein
MVDTNNDFHEEPDLRIQGIQVMTETRTLAETTWHELKT